MSGSESVADHNSCLTPCILTAGAGVLVLVLVLVFAEALSGSGFRATMVVFRRREYDRVKYPSGRYVDDFTLAVVSKEVEIKSFRYRISVSSGRVTIIKLGIASSP